MNAVNKAFHRLEWKQQHYQPTIEKSDEEHVCAYCNEHYTGNYCPQCGLQYGRERFTWKSVALNMMDLWGMGNRNIAVTLWHLVWRPGYMIGDYLRNKHRAYFPPVPLLVVTCLLFTLMVSTLHISWNTDLDTAYKVEFEKEYEKGINLSKQLPGVEVEEVKKDQETLEFEKVFSQRMESLNELLKAQQQWCRDHIEYSLLISNIFMILAAGWVFRFSPRMGKLTLVESFYAQMYIDCQMMLITIPYTLITWQVYEAFILPYLLPFPITLIVLIYDYYQLCGFTLWGTIWRLAMMLITLLSASIFLSTIGVCLYLFLPLIGQ